MKWKLGRVVGRGGSCVVRRIKQEGSHSEVKYCAKIIRLDSLAKYERDSAIREVKLLKTIPSHPHILSLSDSFSVAGNLYLVTLFCEGGDLHTFIRSHPSNNLPPSTLFPLLSQLLSAIKHLHAIPLLHRDIKSKNIFLDASKTHVKLGDFGIAVPGTHAMTAVGTPNSMAPEVLSGTGSGYGAEADCWSLGVVVYEMGTGRVPFHAPSLERVVERIQRGVMDPFDLEGHVFVDNVWKEVVEGLLRKNVKERFRIRDVEGCIERWNQVQIREEKEAVEMEERLKKRRSDLPVGGRQLPKSQVSYFVPFDGRNEGKPDFHALEVKMKELESKVGVFIIQRVFASPNERQVVSLTPKEQNEVVELRNELRTCFDVCF